jgi:hypothetical protein
LFNNVLVMALMPVGSAACSPIYEKSNAVICNAAGCAEAGAENARWVERPLPDADLVKAARALAGTGQMLRFVTKCYKKWPFFVWR